MSEAPTDSPANPEERAQVANAFRAALARAEATRGAPEDDEIAAYVDGTLEPADREIFEMQLEDDPLLRAEVDAVAALRREMQQRRRTLSPRAWALAAALVAAAGAIFAWRMAEVPEREVPWAVVVQDASGAVGLDRSGFLRGLPLRAGLAAEVAVALRDGTLPRPPARASLAGSAGILMSGTPRSNRGSLGLVGLVVLEPVAAVVRGTTPTLRWQAEPGARGYTAEVYDESSNAVAVSGTLTATDWTVAPPLTRGRVYLWQVTAETPSGPRSAPAPPQPQARFAVLDEPSSVALDADLASGGGSHLAAAVAYARAGLDAEATRELDELAGANPASPLVARLRASLAGRRAAERP